MVYYMMRIYMREKERELERERDSRERERERGEREREIVEFEGERGRNGSLIGLLLLLVTLDCHIRIMDYYLTFVTPIICLSCSEEISIDDNVRCC